jgi:hypothetical protein
MKKLDKSEMESYKQAGWNKQYLIKKDVILYHPHALLVLAGTILLSNRPPIIGMDNVVFTDDKQIAEYMEEIG